MSTISVSATSTVSTSDADNNSYIVEDGGTLTISAASGDAIDLTSGVEIQSGGVLIVSANKSGTTLVSSATVESGGTLSLFKGTLSDTVIDGGALIISGGSVADDVLLNGGADIDLQTSSSTLSGDIVFANGGNLITVDKALSAGALSGAVFQSFGAADKIDVTALVAGGGVVTMTSATGSNEEVISISGGGVVDLFTFSGAAYDDETLAVVSSGGFDDIEYGSSSSSSGGTTSTLSSGTTTGLTVSSGETLSVLSGATVVSTTVADGGALVIDGGADSVATVSSGGSETLSGAGVATGDLVYGSLTVDSGTLSSATIENGGNVVVDGGGVDQDSTLLAGGDELILGSASGDQIHGVQTVSAGTAAVMDETVYSGGVLSLALKGVTASGTMVLNGGSLELNGNIVATDTTLSGGGLLDLQSPKATLSGSLAFEGGGNTLQFSDISSATFGDNAVISGFSSTDKVEITSAAYSFSDLTLSQTTSGDDTVAEVLSGGTVVESIAFAGTSLNGDLSLVSDNNGGSILEITPVGSVTSVTSATSAGAYTVSAGDTLVVESGGSVIDPTVEPGGALIVNGGADSGAVVQGGGFETVSAGSASGDQIFGSAAVLGGTASNETVESGGVLNIDPGTGADEVLSGGGTIELTGPDASLTGSLTFLNGHNSLIVDAIANPGAGDQAVISGFSSSDNIDLTDISATGASISYTANSNGTETVTVSGDGDVPGTAVAESFIFDDQAAYGPGSMALIHDSGSGVELVKTTTPSVSFTSPGGFTNQASYDVNGYADVGADPEAAGAAVTVYESVGDVQVAVGTGKVGANGYWSADVTFQNDSGANVLSASVTDAAGQTGSTSQSLSYDVDTSAAAFTPGDLVVSVSGDGDGSGVYGDNQASPISLDQITTSGTFVGQMVLPEQTTTVNGVTEYAVSGEYGSSSEGSLELSADGHSLVIAGYGVDDATYNAGGAAVYGNAALAQSTSVQGGQYTAVARVIADIGANGSVDSSTALYNVFNEQNPRSVATVDGTSFWISGQGEKGSTNQGLFYTTDGASSATAINTATDTREAVIYDDELYVSADSTQGATNISDYGAPPTSATTGTILTGINTSVTLNGSNGNSINGSSGTVYLSPENFFFANANTLYVADGGDPKNGGLGDGGLQKWTFDGSQWSLDYTLSAGLNLVPDTSASGTSGLIGLTGDVVGDDVYLYATNSTLTDLGATGVYAVADSLGATTAAQAAGESFTEIYAASPDENIRGISFAPTEAAPCYLAGTLISTARGAVAVENLREGDLAVTASGALRPIVWIGHRDLDVARHPWPLEILPVRVREGAFGQGLPRRDLWLSPQHAVLVDGVLIPIIRLANGATIKQAPAEKISYWHVELESHDALLAEGLPAESFLDCGTRQGFANAQGFMELHPTFAPKSWDDACAPLKESGPEVEAVRARLMARALELGHRLVEDPDLHVLADGRRIEPASREDGAYVFQVPPAREIKLVSRTFRPADEGGESGDRRHLGVVVQRIALDGVAHDLAAFRQGWHEPEGADGRQWRWTDGAADLPGGAGRIEVAVGEGPRYWSEGARQALLRASCA